jgi:hypothetical protein
VTLRDAVSELMVRAHLIPRELADQHAAEMTEVELAWRFCWYARNGFEISEMELSVVGRTDQSGSDFYQVFGSATATARLTALNPVPEFPTEQENGKESARAGSKKPGPMVDRAVSAIH